MFEKCILTYTGDCGSLSIRTTTVLFMTIENSHSVLAIVSWSEITVESFGRYQE